MRVASDRNISSLKFDELAHNLRARVDAHKRFSAFDLNDWIEQHIVVGRGETVVDLGCGSGNHLGIWAQQVGTHGTVIGLDKSAALLREAQRVSTCFSRVELLCADMEGNLPLKAQSVGWLIACFSIYYVQSVEAMLKRIIHVLVPDGVLVLVGPTLNNARQLYDFHYRLTGVGMTPKARARSARLQEEFLPLLQSMFSEVKTTVLENKLSFPTAQDFADYYLNTPLVVESVGERGIDPHRLIQEVNSMQEWVIQKETIVIQARSPYRGQTTS